MGVVAFGVYYLVFMLTHKIYIAILPSVALAVFIYFCTCTETAGIKQAGTL